MNRRLIGLVVCAAAGCGLLAGADAPVKPGALPAPQTDKGRPLMQALNDRQSRRNISPDKKLSPQELSNLLWAACGTDIVMTVSDGRVVYRDGEWPTIDVEKAKAEAERVKNRILSQM